MGYTTKFKGRFNLSKPLTVPQYNELRHLAEGDTLRETNTMPDSWLQWIPTEDGIGIKWDGREKFDYYLEWLQWLIDNLLEEWGIEVSGSVAYEGENRKDRGDLIVAKGKVRKQEFIFVPIKMSPEEFAKKMKELLEAGKQADSVDLMCAVLAGLGYQVGISIFKSWNDQTGFDL